MRKTRLGLILLRLSLITFVLQFPTMPAAYDEAPLAEEPDIVVVGWTTDDTAGGNGDYGLQPGETAVLWVSLSNRGNETARWVDGQLSEVVDHPDVEILDKFATWPDLPADGTPASSDPPHFGVRVAATRPCGWQIPLRLELSADGGYLVEREFVLVMTPPERIDLAEGSARPFYYGAEDADHLGWAVTTGDFDGDGYDDLVLAAPDAYGPGNTRVGAGEAYVVYGSSVPMHDTDLAVLFPSSTVIYGADTGDDLGRSIATGDINGDGYDDLFIGAPESDGPGNARSRAGEVAVILGRADRLQDIDLAAPPSQVFFVYGATGSDGLGDTVASGDVNGDGFYELVAAAIDGDGPADTRSGAGDVVIVYGGPDLYLDIDLDTAPDGVAVVYGADSSDTLGTSIAVGDVNGDGLDDAVLGARHGDGPRNGRSFAGEATIVYGQSATLSDLDLATFPEGTSRIYGANAFDFLGRSVAAGDLNGDGFDDVAFGSNWADGPDNARETAGEVAVVYGVSSMLSDIDLAAAPEDVIIVYGADSNDQIGGDIFIGDTDGDGLAELFMVGSYARGPGNARDYAGEVAVLHGTLRSPSSIDLASAPSHVGVIYAADTEDFLRTGATGDLNGDGIEDIVLGSYWADSVDNMRDQAGEVAIIPGAPRTRYRWDADAHGFIDATAGVNTSLACDDCGVTIPVGFEFVFYGRPYNQVTVSSNGYLSFGGAGDRLPGRCVPAGNPPNALIAPFWEDLNLEAGGSVHYLLEGDAPHRRLTVEWHDVPLWPDIDTATFEVTLFETSNQVLFQYQDVSFGGTNADHGGTAVVGVENGPGLVGTPFSCFSPRVNDASSVRFRGFSNRAIVWSDDVEAGVGGWTASGLWHRVQEPSCSPSSRSGEFSWYFGQDSSCDYASFLPLRGALTSEVLEDLPQDAELTFWGRRSTDGGATTDQSFVEVQTDGGGFEQLKRVTENSDHWLYAPDVTAPVPALGGFASFDLSSYAGSDVEIRFSFSPGGSENNDYLGWMVDDIAVQACPVHDGAAGGGVASQALATASPDRYCEGESGRVDALGSYCAACPTLAYQWFESGSPIVGAMDAVHDISPTQTVGHYEYTVEIGCAANPACADTSDPVEVRVLVVAEEVGPTLFIDKINLGTELLFRWTDVADAADYVVLSDGDPTGSFEFEEGATPSGETGLVIPVPEAELSYFVVAGRNPDCGVGPK